MNSAVAQLQRKGQAWQWLAALFAVAVLVNFVWEMAQSPLYAGAFNVSTAFWHCLVASLGDGLLVLLIFSIGWMITHRPYWFERPGVGGYALMMVTGLAISMGVEFLAVQIGEWWSYTKRMPLVPVLGVGLAPVAQMLILPPLTFYLTTAWRRRALAKKRRAMRENTSKG